MRIIFALAIIAFLFIGCATLGETIKGITADPAGYASEATNTANNAKDTVPELPYAVCVGIGYAAAFLRRWYKNFKIDQAKKDLT